MARAPSVLAAAAAVACSLSVTLSAATCCLGLQDTRTIDARVHGVGADYFAAGLHAFKCELVPADGSDSFYAACTHEQARNLGGGDVITLELGPSPAADLPPAVAEAEARLNIVRPSIQIVGATRRAREARARRDVPADGPRSILLMILNYADMQVTYANESSVRRAMHNPNGPDVDELFQAASYGRVSWPEASTTVVTVNSPLNGADVQNCNNPNEFSDEADRLLAEQHPNIDHGNFIHQGYLIPDQVPNCHWDGIGGIDECHDGTASAHCKIWARMGSSPILAHELGHNLGVLHASDDVDDDGVQETEYGDPTCVMGQILVGNSINAPHRELLGFLGDGNGAMTYNMACAAQPAARVTLTISRLDLAPGGSNPNPNLVRIARYLDPSNYLLSFKSSSDWDGSTGPAGYINRLQIHTHSGDFSNTMIVGTLGEGESFTGLANRAGSPVPLHIYVTGVSADAITVTVDTGCRPTPPPTPSSAPTTSTPSSAPTPHPTFHRESYCPTGYHDYGVRYNVGLGRITIVTAHEQCAARCTVYSGMEYAGGCRGYMTGMYYGLLFCRSYGSDAHTSPCAHWAKPGNKGLFSGNIGDVNARTGQENVGGQCCSSENWRTCGANFCI